LGLNFPVFCIFGLSICLLYTHFTPKLFKCFFAEFGSWQSWIGKHFTWLYIGAVVGSSRQACIRPFCTYVLLCGGCTVARWPYSRLYKGRRALLQRYQTEKTKEIFSLSTFQKTTCKSSPLPLHFLR